MDLDQAIRELAARFQAHDMRAHIALLRGFYRRRQASKRAQALGQQLWDEDMVLSWLALFQIAPMAGYYRTLQPGQPCPCGGRRGDGASSFTAATFPGGHVWTCLACQASWLTLHATP